MRARGAPANRANAVGRRSGLGALLLAAATVAPAAAAPPETPPRRLLAPRALVGGRRASRPLCGRDIGPDYGLPLELSPDPFKGTEAQKAWAKAPTVPTAAEEAVAKVNPLATPVADTVLPAPDKPDPHGPAFHSDTLPDSPEAAVATPGKVSTAVQGSVADAVQGAINEKGLVARMPEAETFTGISCQAVCARMEISKAKFPGTNCLLYADCHKGTDLTVCTEATIGYTNGDGVTRPAEEWSGACGNGDYPCDKCVSSEFKAEVKKCVDSPDMTTCLDKMDQESKQLGSLEHLPEFCTQWAGNRYIDCVQLAEKPTNTSKDWRCFPKMEECKRHQTPPETFGGDEREGESVWKNAQPPPSPLGTASSALSSGGDTVAAPAAPVAPPPAAAAMSPVVQPAPKAPVAHQPLQGAKLLPAWKNW